MILWTFWPHAEVYKIADFHLFSDEISQTPKLDIAYPQLSSIPIQRALLLISKFMFKQLDLSFQLSLP